MTLFRKSLALSFASKYSTVMIAFVTNVVLARLLAPEEVGIFSAVAALTIIAHMLRDLGVSFYVIQEKQLTRQRLSAAFVVTASSSFLIGILLYLLREPLATFYGRTEIAEVAGVLSLNFFLIPFASIPMSLMRKEMDFSTLLILGLVNSVVHASTAIGLAWVGFSYLSPAWASVAGNVATAVLCTVLHPFGRLSIPTIKDLKTVVNFGGRMTFVTLFMQTGEAAPEIIIGKFFGMRQIGLFSRASGVARFFHMGVLQGLVPVLLPHFMKRLDRKQDISNEYLTIVSSLCCLSWPFFGFLFVMANPVIRLLYGENWLAASEILQWLAVAAALATVYALSNNVFVALHKMGELVRLQTVQQTVTILLLLILAFRGFHWLLAGIVFSRFIGIVLWWYYLRKIMLLSVPTLGKTLRPALLMLVACVGALVGMHEIMDWREEQWPTNLALSIVVFTIVWFVSLWLTRAPLGREVLNVASTLSQRFTRRGRTTPHD